MEKNNACVYVWACVYVCVCVRVLTGLSTNEYVLRRERERESVCVKVVKKRRPIQGWVCSYIRFVSPALTFRSTTTYDVTMCPPPRPSRRREEEFIDVENCLLKASAIYPLFCTKNLRARRRRKKFTICWTSQLEEINFWNSFER